MGPVSGRVEDRRILRLLRGYLDSRALEGGLVSPTVRGYFGRCETPVALGGSG